jgi:hypothetical protein
MNYFRILITLVLSFVVIVISAQQNLKVNYTPLKSKGILPEIFTQNIRKIVGRDLSDLNSSKEKDKNIKSDYLTAINYEIERIVKSGNTLVNDEVTTYLNKIADVILANDTALRNKLHIFALKSFVVNAYSYDKGYIFIDLGLIAQAESEAQVAYTLCHEISHYTKQHNINSYVKNEKVDKNYSGKSDEEKLIEKCQYSKDQESEADLEGFKMLERSNYDFREAEKDFDVLQYSHLPFELVEFKSGFFETKNYKIPDRYFLKEVSSIRNNSNEDDSKHTHPSTPKRKEAIHNLINNRDAAGTKKYIVGEKEFEYVRDITRMELCRLYLVFRDYPNALYSAYIMLQKYPDNEYLAEIVSKSLYGMSLKSMGMINYNSESYLENGIPGYDNIESYPQQLYYLYSKMPTNEWVILSMNYVYRAHKKFPANKQLTGYADTLFKCLGRIDWGLNDFVRIEKKVAEVKKDTIDNTQAKSKTDLIAKIQKESVYHNQDTAYYKDIFVDLFMTDKEFCDKFPVKGNTFTSMNGFSDYRHVKYSKVKKKNSKKREYISFGHKIDKVILLEPFYLKANPSKREEVQYIKSDKKQEELVATIHDCAKKQNFNIVTLDPGMLTSADVDKMNDYSVVMDWFNEKFDADISEGNQILNTDDLDELVNKYGTHYVLKTGIVSYNIGLLRRRTYYFSFIYDLKTSDLVYKKYEEFRDTDSKALINGKVYQTFYEITHSK